MADAFLSPGYIGLVLCFVCERKFSDRVCRIKIKVSVVALNISSSNEQIGISKYSSSYFSSVKRSTHTIA